MVITSVFETLDHKLVLSREYLAENMGIQAQENLVIREAEPTAINLFIYIKRILLTKIPPAVKLIELKLHETNDSYATWVNNTDS